MIIEVSVAIIAACMVLILITAIVVALKLSKSVQHLDETIANVEYKVDNALDEVTTTLCQATTTLTSLDELTVSIKGKVDATDPLFHCISRIGSIADSFVSGARPEINLSNNINFAKSTSDKIKVADIAELVGLGVLLWQKYKQRS